MSKFRLAAAVGLALLAAFGCGKDVRPAQSPGLLATMKERDELRVDKEKLEALVAEQSDVIRVLLSKADPERFPLKGEPRGWHLEIEEVAPPASGKCLVEVCKCQKSCRCKEKCVCNGNNGRCGPDCKCKYKSCMPDR